ncbi:hypothetical protein [Brevundimonas diminuta]|uniref:hypothetical protein n=1 Tax=Brevundimonas diminuta TaxID=293 RepID=UPI003207D6EF
MGRAKDDWIERQQHAAVAKALLITEGTLNEYGYEIAEDPSGLPNRARVMWDDDAPDGVEIEYEGDRAFTPIEFDDEPDWPDE